MQVYLQASGIKKKYSNSGLARGSVLRQPMLRQRSNSSELQMLTTSIKLLIPAVRRFLFFIVLAPFQRGESDWG